MSPSPLTARTVATDPAVLRVRRMAGGSGLAGFWLIGGAALQLLYNIGLGRTYGAAATGLFAFSFSLLHIAGPVGQLGMQETLLRYVSVYRGTEKRGTLAAVLRYAWTVGLAGSVAMALLLWWNVNRIVAWAGKPELTGVLPVTLLAVPAVAALNIAAAALQGAFRLGMSFMLREVGRTLPVVAAIAAAMVFSLDFGSFLLLTVAGYMAVAGWAAYVSRTVAYANVRRAPIRWREWTGFSLAVMTMDVFRSSFGWTDTFVLGFFLPAAEVGVYFVALRLALLVTLALAAFDAALAPMAADLWARGEAEHLDHAFKLTTRWTTAVVIPVGILIVLLRVELMSLFGPDFIVGSTVLVIVVVGRLVNGITGGVARLLMMTGHHRLELVNAVASMALLISTLLLLVPRYGVVGAAVSNAFTIVIMNVVKLVQVKLRVGIQPYDARYAKIVVASVTCTLVGMGLLALTNGLPPLVKASLVGMGAGGVYLMTLYAQGLTEDDRHVLRLVGGSIGRRR